MGRFPMYVDLTDRKVMVIGGGRTALRKINMLLQFDARIGLICAAPCDKLKEMADNDIISLFDMDFYEDSLSLLDDAFMVICASDDHILNRKAALYCSRNNIWVDCVDSAELSTFVFPSVVRRDNVVIGISTSGRVPALTRHLREMIEELVPEWYGRLEQELSDRRDILKNSNLAEDEKRQELRQIIEKAEDMHGNDRGNQKKQTGRHSDRDGT